MPGDASFNVEILSESQRKVEKLLLMFGLILLSALLVLVVGALPPVIIRQPVESEILFKVSLNENRQRAFEVECEADGDPKPK